MILLLLLAITSLQPDPLAPLGEDRGPPAVAIIHRGDTITLKAGTGSLSIATSGRALNPAAAGERVRVMVTSTRRTIDAVAEAPGVARLAQP